MDGGDGLRMREVQQFGHRARVRQAARLQLGAHAAVEHEEVLAAQRACQVLVGDGDAVERVVCGNVSHGR